MQFIPVIEKSQSNSRHVRVTWHAESFLRRCRMNSRVVRKKSHTRNRSLRNELENGKRPRVFGAVHSYSSHSFLLRNWLRSHGIVPDRDVQIVIVPPAQVHANLKAGHLDGYCVGEPWNSLAVLSRTGWCVATSEELAPGHPEKVLMVPREFAERSEREHLALIAALMESCRFCSLPENRDRS